MNLKNICIILDRPEESRNIGSACRAMANNGISRLRIVGKRANYDNEKVQRLSIHAYKIWERAEFFESIHDATKDCVLCAATTRRRGKKRKGKLLLPEEFARIANKITGNETDSGFTNDNRNTRVVAVVFGNERTGLTDAEVAECNLAVTIPSSEDFASLNLSHAVQIICYHLFREKNSARTGYTPITLERLDVSVNLIVQKLREIGFFTITGELDMAQFWRSILSRAALSESEAQYIEKTFSKAAGIMARKSLGKENGHKT